MASKKVEIFRKMTNTELANYYVDVCAYREKAAVDEQIDIQKEMASRFVDQYADIILKLGSDDIADKDSEGH